MADIRSETRSFIEAVLDGDPALASLTVVGITPEDLTATIAPGQTVATIGGTTYGNGHAPFQREDLVELVVRMQRSRWRRYDSYALSLVPATYDDMKTLGEYDPMRQDGRTMGCECGDGWYDLLNATLSWIAEAQPQAWFKATQIKEKFGTLRFYHSAATGWISDIIDAAEHLSGSVCDECGAPGRTRGPCWFATRCENHRGERS